MSAQQIIFKVYYNDLVEQQPEIRRFSLDVSANKDIYQLLETNIAQLNSNYPEGQFTLQYMDEDQDRITFSSDGELRSALAATSLGSTFKVYVKPKSKKAQEPNANTNTTIHVGVTCDGCGGPVIGNRYKCVECPDYDLCQACSEKNLHREHNMMKLVKVNSPFPNFFGGGRRCGRGGFGRGRCGAMGARFYHHFMNQQQAGANSFQIPADMTHFLSQFNGKELAEFVEAHLPPYLRTAKINELINRYKTGEQADKPVDQSNLLENVGEFLREILSPFGIDCDYFVDNKQPSNSATGQTTTEQATTEQATTEDKKQEATTTNSTSVEQKPSAPSNSEAPSASNNSTTGSNIAPSFNNLLQQFNSIFHPGFQQSSAAAASTINDPQVEERKKIDECIERMTAMGFVDTNGVLSELIRAKRGDLNQVLDALNPRNYKS